MESFVEEAEQQKAKHGKQKAKYVIEQPKPEPEEDEIPIQPMARPVALLDGIDKLNRPSVKEYRADGSSPRKRRAISLGLSELILPPYTKNVIATYRLKLTDRIDPTTKEKPEPQDAIFPGSYTLYDKFEKDPILKQKLVENPGPQQIITDENGKQIRKSTNLPIEFVAGLLQVNVEKNYAKYVFMELHPNNGSNRHRENSNSIEFERVDLKTTKSSAFVEAELNLAEDASRAVKDIKNADLIIGYAVQFGINTYMRDPGDIKNELRQKALLEPKKFFSLAKDISPAITLNIHAGMMMGIIDYQPDRHRFIWAETQEPIHVVAVSEDPVASFTKAIQSDPDKREFYDELLETINYWE